MASRVGSSAAKAVATIFAGSIASRGNSSECFRREEDTVSAGAVTMGTDREMVPVGDGSNAKLPVPTSTTGAAMEESYEMISKPSSYSTHSAAPAVAGGDVDDTAAASAEFIFDRSSSVSSISSSSTTSSRGFSIATQQTSFTESLNALLDNPPTDAETYGAFEAVVGDASTMHKLLPAFGAMKFDFRHLGDAVRDMLNNEDILNEAKEKIEAGAFADPSLFRARICGSQSPSPSYYGTEYEYSSRRGGSSPSSASSAKSRGEGKCCASISQDFSTYMSVKWSNLANDFPCGICQDVLAAPLALNCSHSYCGECVHDLLNSCSSASSSTTVAGETEKEEVEIEFLCPTCKTTIEHSTFERTLDDAIANRVHDMKLEIQAAAASQAATTTTTEKASWNVMDEEMKHWEKRRRRYLSSAKEKEEKAATKEKAASLHRGSGGGGGSRRGGAEGDEEENALWEIVMNYVLPVVTFAVVVVIAALRARK